MPHKKNDETLLDAITRLEREKCDLRDAFERLKLSVTEKCRSEVREELSALETTCAEWIAKLDEEIARVRAVHNSYNVGIGCRKTNGFRSG